MKRKGVKENKGSLGIKILLKYECMAKNKRVKRFCDFAVLFLGIFLQVFNTRVINYLGDEICEHLKSQSLMIGIASSLGLTTIVMFGFNLGESVQQFWKEKNGEHGLGEKEGLMTSGVQINYWQIFLLILLYVCLAADWCTLFYILLTYDVLCFVLLILKLWLIENVGEQYWDYSFNHDMQGKLTEILEHCVDDNDNIKIGIVRTYVERLYDYLNFEKENREFNGFYGEKLYEELKKYFNDTMDNLALEQNIQSRLLLEIIHNFCKRLEKPNDFKVQLMLGVMITYALDWEKNIDNELFYREMTNWNDKTLGLRYCIAVARMEYLYTVHRANNRILLSENLSFLYHPVRVEFSYRDIICILWYCWCCEDKKVFMLYTENMWRIICLSHEDIKLHHVSETGESLYMLIKGLKY